MISLTFEGFELGLTPQLGGTVAYFRHEGRDLLRAATSAAPTGSAAFPMVPFCGRIANGRFPWNGREVRLTPNFPPEPHAIHGHGWTRPWEVTEKTANRAVLRYDHTAGDWPWAYRAEQHFGLGPSGLTLDLSLTNLSEEPMPAGIGWHPYFAAAGASIKADTTLVWETGPDMLPLPPRTPKSGEQLSGGAHVPDLKLDTPFSTGSRPITIRWPAQNLTLRMVPVDTLRFLVVYTPPGQDFFCAEPTSHVPNMVNLDAPAEMTGLVTLQQGATLSGRIALSVDTGATGKPA